MTGEARVQSEFDRAVEQLAMFDARMDEHESGTPAWDDLAPTTREEYLKEAQRRVAALGLLGWAPLHPYGALYLRDPRDTLKALRETLCRAESATIFLRDERGEIEPDADDLARISRIIAEIDRQRPLGPDGKHGDLHTPTCGCEDR